ncbi:MAG: DUF4352 domain-containing protein [Lachnospiraceae bacterium]
MKKKIYSGLLITILLTGITGCGKKEDNITNSPVPTKLVSNTDTSKNTVPENTKVLATPDFNKQESAKPSISQKPENTEPSIAQKPKSTEPAITPKPEIKIGELSASQQYSDISRTIKVLGLKEYKKLKSKKYTDKASKGKKFLILFLSIKNNSNEDDYINYNYISAKIDGIETEHTAIFNNPQNYPTIFDTIKSGKNAAGFIVWEVPSSWKKLELTYSGWKDINNVKLEAAFTPEDLSDPVIYNANDYN